jgi:hypothetical protein
MKTKLMCAALLVLWSIPGAAQPATVRSSDSTKLPGVQAEPGVVRPLAAPGLVTLSEEAGGGLSAGTYKFGVVAVNGDDGEGQFDALGYSGKNSITIAADRMITVRWQAVPGAAKYHLYIWGPTATYYQRYYETTETSYTISSNPAGPVPVPIKVTPSDVGGRLPAGNYYFDIEAEFPDGVTIDQTNLNAFPVAAVHTDTGSVALSWGPIKGATQYRVYVVTEQDGSPRTHTKYFTTVSNSVVVTGSESYVRGTKASQMHGNGEVESSGAGVFGSIRTITNSKSFFQGDIQITAAKDADASFQASRYSNTAFAGLSLRTAGHEQWSLGLLGTANDFRIDRGPTWRLIINESSGLLDYNGSIQPRGDIQIFGPKTLHWTANDVNAVRIYTFSNTYGIGTNATDLTLFSGGRGGITFTHGGVTSAPQMRIDSQGNVGIGTSAPTSKLQVVGLPVFKNNAEAIAGGLTAGAFYRTGGDPDLVAVVH